MESIKQEMKCGKGFSQKYINFLHLLISLYMTVDVSYPNDIIMKLVYTKKQ